MDHGQLDGGGAREGYRWLDGTGRLRGWSAGVTGAQSSGVASGWWLVQQAKSYQGKGKRVAAGVLHSVGTWRGLGSYWITGGVLGEMDANASGAQFTPRSRGVPGGVHECKSHGPVHSLPHPPPCPSLPWGPPAGGMPGWSRRRARYRHLVDARSTVSTAEKLPQSLGAACIHWCTIP